MCYQDVNGFLSFHTVFSHFNAPAPFVCCRSSLSLNSWHRSSAVLQVELKGCFDTTTELDCYWKASKTAAFKLWFGPRVLQIIFVWTVFVIVIIVFLGLLWLAPMTQQWMLGLTALAVSLSNTPNEKRSLHRTAVFHVNVFIYRAT